MAADNTNHSPNGMCDALNVEKIYLDKGAAAAREAFVADFVRTGEHNPARFDNEARRLANDDHANHIFGAVILDYEHQQYGDDNIRRTDLNRDNGNKFRAIASQYMLNHYDELTAPGLKHGVHSIGNLLSGGGPGIMASDIAQAQQRLEDANVMRHGADTAVHLLMDHHADLFHKIAGTRNTVDLDALNGALHDNRFNAGEKSEINYLISHWNNDEVNQLKNQHMSFADVVKGFNPMEAGDSAAVVGQKWGHWGGAFFGALGNAAGFVTGALPMHWGQVHAQAGEITMDTLQAAERAQHITLSDASTHKHL